MAATASILCGCTASGEGTYGYDRKFLDDNGIEYVELVAPHGNSKVLTVPAYQGRVMTSTTGGDRGVSYGWINRKFIGKGEVSDQFNNYGGEERFWIGPEGGPFSWYFKEGAEQVYANWKVPSVIDTDGFDVVSRESGKVVFHRRASMTNASGIVFDMELGRTIELEDAGKVLGLPIGDDVKSLCYSTSNSITNRGDSEWTRETGLPSIWLLGMYPPSVTTTVFIPYNKDHDGRIVKDDYFGEIPADRIAVKDGVVYFRIDGKFRAKIGLPKGSAKDVCGSYDSAAHMLNILKYTVPEGLCDYVNSQWGRQDDNYGGDVINSYNDGPTETGTIMGPFYEIETSSPGAALKPGETITHKQYTFHFEGPDESLSKIAEAVLGVDLRTVAEVF